jgi:hypothetical protein
MRRPTGAVWFMTALIIVVCLPTQSKSQISAGLARKCQRLMGTAHPTEWYKRTGNAAAQREYFRTCIEKKGDMSGGAETPKQPPPNEHQNQK